MDARQEQDDSRRLLRTDETLPPPRPGVRHVRVLAAGVIVADDSLRKRVDAFFHWPMIVLALLILPLLALDHFYLAKLPLDARGQHWLYWIVRLAFAVIWLAFLVEFIVKITIAECRVEYVKRNWLDVVIILVPVLRPIRAAHLAKTTRVFTLRGVGMKFARYVFTMVIGLEATDRILHRIGVKVRRERKDPESMTRQELIGELRRLRKLNDAWETWYGEHRNYVKQRGEVAPAQPPLAPAPPDEPDEAAVEAPATSVRSRPA
ncbi:MAG: hypothetical protein ACYTJ0_17165 [Planctomycetota bacterium]|jgi:hypothetical protein